MRFRRRSQVRANPCGGRWLYARTLGASLMGLGLLVLLLFAFRGLAADQPLAPRIVDLTAEDGTKLKASYFSAGEAGPGVLLLHQCNQDRKNWDDLATQLAAAGIHVLTLDYRGYGESGGPSYKDLKMDEWHTSFLDKLPGDIDIALEYLQSQPAVTRHIIGIGGASCSVNQAIETASRHPEVKSLVLLSGSTDRKGRAFLRQAGKIPMLFVASDDDTDAAPLMQWLFSLSKNTGSRFVHYQTGGHGTDLFAAHKGLPGTIVDWFVQTLIKTPGSAPPTHGEPTAASYSPDMLEIIDTGGAAKVEARLRLQRRNDPNAQLFSEMVVNIIGYEHLQEGDKSGAIDILRLNAYAYPHSANVYDSMSDAYLAAGQKDLARENAEKALQMLDKDTSTSDEMKKMIRESAAKKLKELGPNSASKEK
jgi:dienelactone hydrolase